MSVCLDNPLFGYGTAAYHGVMSVAAPFALIAYFS